MKNFKDKALETTYELSKEQIKSLLGQTKLVSKGLGSEEHSVMLELLRKIVMCLLG